MSVGPNPGSHRVRLLGSSDGSEACEFRIVWAPGLVIFDTDGRVRMIDRSEKRSEPKCFIRARFRETYTTRPGLAWFAGESARGATVDASGGVGRKNNRDCVNKR